MPLYLDNANLIFSKAIIEAKYAGGCEQFRNDWKMDSNSLNDEDDELFMLAVINVDEFDLYPLFKKGLSFDSEKQTSTDFVAVGRYEGVFWEPNWLKANASFAWHVNCKKEQEERAIEISEHMTMDVLEKLLNKGIEVLKTIRTGK